MSHPGNPPARPRWVDRSNQFSEAYLNVLSGFEPELMGQLGFLECDTGIIDWTPGFRERKLQALERFSDECRQERDREPDPHVREDLEILLWHAGNAIREIRLRDQYELPYLNVGMFVFSGISLLLDERNAADRHQAALVRLRRYTGLEEDYQPLATLVQHELAGLLGTDRLAPTRRELESDLGNSARYVAGMRELFERFGVADHAEALAAFEQQLGAFDAFLATELLPRAREDHRLPLALYSYLLENHGVEQAPAELALEARQAFGAIQAQMASLAAEIAAEQGMGRPDYPAVIAELKREQVPAEAVVDLYKQRLAELEALLQEHRLITVPARPVSIRLATEAESARVPNPYLDIPRLIGNQGEQGVFVIPTRVPPPPGSEESAVQVDDFSFAAASWPVTAHEARPGHELQFASMLDQGVSLARAIFSFNSTNCEGWALYCEHLMRPYMPKDAQLVALQLTLLRTARAFLDPELQLGTLQPADAFRLLREEVCVSEAMANQEVDRYTFRAPGQATTYFYGFQRMLELRAEVERERPDLDLCAFHDFILAQGLLPPTLLRSAVRAHFGLTS